MLLLAWCQQRVLFFVSLESSVRLLENQQRVSGSFPCELWSALGPPVRCACCLPLRSMALAPHACAEVASGPVALCVSRKAAVQRTSPSAQQVQHLARASLGWGGQVRVPAAATWRNRVARGELVLRRARSVEMPARRVGEVVGSSEVECGQFRAGDESTPVRDRRERGRCGRRGRG